MGIFDNQPKDTAQQAADALVGIIRGQNDSLLGSAKMGWQLLWNNPSATPQQILDKLGTNAKLIFQLSDLNWQTLAAVAQIAGTTPPIINGVPATYTYVINADGTITLTPVESQK